MNGNNKNSINKNNIIKKISLLLCALTMLFMLVACEKKEPQTGMPNPMVKIDDDSEFEKQLGIKIDTSAITTEEKTMFIIAQTTADIRFSKENVEGEPVECTLRATKDEGVKENPVQLLAGMYHDFDEPVTIDYTEFSVTNYNANSEESGNIDVYTWDKDGLYCSLSIEGTMSQMQIAEVMDSVMSALGMSPF